MREMRSSIGEEKVKEMLEKVEVKIEEKGKKGVL